MNNSLSNTQKVQNTQSTQNTTQSAQSTQRTTQFTQSIQNTQTTQNTQNASSLNKKDNLAQQGQNQSIFRNITDAKQGAGTQNSKVNSDLSKTTKI